MTTIVKTIIIGIAMALVAASAIAAVLLFVNPVETNSQAGSQAKQQQDFSTDEAANSSSNNGYRQIDVSINGRALVADISATNEQMTKGLSVKDHLAENESMLFVFENEAGHAFWMKDMKFPIDILWIAANKTIVHIEHNLEPCSSVLLCPTYNPDSESMYVLETVGGFAESYGIVEGMNVDFDLNG